jgi:hypothetical protein
MKLNGGFLGQDDWCIRLGTYAHLRHDFWQTLANMIPQNTPKLAWAD